MFLYKQLALAVAMLLFGSCAARSFSSEHRPRLTKIQAVRIASKVPYPAGYSPNKYAFKGFAIFLPSQRQWGISYDLTSRGPVAFGSGYFAVWIDDATGKFDHYSFGH